MESPAKLELAQLLWEMGCVEVDLEQGFRLKYHDSHPDAPLSPVKFNFRTQSHPNQPGPLTAAGLRSIARFFADVIADEGISFKRLVGLPHAGEPLAEATRRELGLPAEALIYLHKNEYKGGRVISGPIRGDFQLGDSCAIFDDVLSHSRSKMEGRNILARKGGAITDLFIVVDRQQGGTKSLTEIGINVRPIFKARELIFFGAEAGLIDHDAARRVSQYLLDSARL